MLDNVRVGPKLVGGFLVVAVVAAGTGVVGWLNQRDLESKLVEITDQRMAGLVVLADLRAAQQSVWVGESRLTGGRSADFASRQAEYAYIDQNLRRIDESWKAYQAIPHSTEETAQWEGLRSLWQAWRQAHDAVRTLAQERDRLAAQGETAESPLVQDADRRQRDASARAREAILVTQGKLEGLMRLSATEAGTSKAAAARAAAAASWIMLGIALLGAGAATFYGLALARSIRLPLARGVEMMRELEQGHLGRRLQLTRRDEIGALARAMDSFAEDLQKTVVVSMGQIAAGDLTVEIEQKDDQDQIAPALNQTVAALRYLTLEMMQLSAAAVEGRLEARGDATKFQGAYRDVVDGVNQTLDAVITPVNEAAAALERVAQRDLTARMTGSYQGDHAKIKESFNQAVGNLDEGLQQVAVGVEQVASASGQIASGSQSLAQGASEQASSLEQVTGSLRQMASVTRTSASNAKEARATTEVACTGADRGLESMNRLSEAMERIKTSSGSTAKIVKTIDEIAFQTNLLALNAAVEAARAGDAGKGFAVVAEEVRNLAMRSAEAAKNTTSMIEESVRNAESGVQLNGEALGRLQEITTQSKKVGEVMSEIAVASEQQTQGIDQISLAVDQMNQVTQQNAAGSEESASAAEELSAQAEELRSLVKQFRLSETQAVAVAATGTWGAPPAGAPLGRPDAGSAAKPAHAPKLTVVKGPQAKPAVNPAAVIPLDDESDGGVLRSF